MSNDDILLLFHDERLNGERISSLSYSELYEKDSAIPTLSSVLDRAIPSGYYILDLKEKSQRYLNVLSEALKRNSVPKNKIAFQSTKLESLVYLRKTFPESRFIYLSKLRRSIPFFTAPSPIKLAAQLSKHKIYNVSLKGRKFIDEKYINVLISKSIDVFIWTINDVNRANYYAEIGVSGIITDNVLALKRANASTRP